MPNCKYCNDTRKFALFVSMIDCPYCTAISTSEKNNVPKKQDLLYDLNETSLLHWHQIIPTFTGQYVIYWARDKTMVIIESLLGIQRTFLPEFCQMQAYHDDIVMNTLLKRFDDVKVAFADLCSKYSDFHKTTSRLYHIINGGGDLINIAVSFNI